MATAEPIKTGQLLTELQEQEVRAAIAFRGQDIQEWRRERGLARATTYRVIGRTLVPNERYVGELNALVAEFREGMREVIRRADEMPQAA